MLLQNILYFVTFIICNKVYIPHNSIKIHPSYPNPIDGDINNGLYPSERRCENTPHRVRYQLPRYQKDAVCENHLGSEFRQNWGLLDH